MNGRHGRFYLLLAVVALAPFIQPLFRGEVFTFRDHSDYFLPLRHFTSVELRAGNLPLWNPYSGSGERWAANPQTGIFYPPSWLFLVLPFSTAYVLYLALHIYILGLGAFSIFKRLSNPGTALMGATLVMMSGPVLSLLDVQNLLGSVAWFPLVVESALRLKEERRGAWSMSVASLSLVFLAGEPFIAAIGWLCFLAITLRHVLIQAVAALTTASLFISVQLLPFLEMIEDSDRLSRSTRASAFRESITFRDLLAAAVSPYSHSQHLQLLTSSQHFIPSIYVGSMAILLAGLGATAILRRKAAGAPWLALCGLSLMLAAAGRVSLIGMLTRWIGMDLNRYPAKFLPIAAFALIALAMIGARAAASLSFGERCIALGPGLLMIVVALGRFGSADSWTSSWRFSEAMLVCSLVLSIVLLRVDWLASRGFQGAGVAVTLLLGLVAGGGMLQSAPLNASTGFIRVVSGQRKVARLLPAGDGILDRRAWMSGYTNLYERLFDAGTAAPVVPNRYLELHDLALRSPRLDILDWLSVGYVFSKRDLSVAGYIPIARRSGVTLFQNRASSPMIQFFTELEQTDDDRDAYRRFTSSRFDVRSRVVITGEAPRSLAGKGVPIAKGMITRMDGTNATMKVETDRPCLVVLNQLIAAGWKPQVDGKKAKAVVVNGLFRGVFVSGGRHTVVWEYRPLSMLLGAACSLAGVVLWMLLASKWSPVLSGKNGGSQQPIG